MMSKPYRLIPEERHGVLPVTPGGVAHKTACLTIDEGTLQVQEMDLLKMGFSPEEEVTLALAAASNNFDLAIDLLLYVRLRSWYCSISTGQRSRNHAISAIGYT